MEPQQIEEAIEHFRSLVGEISEILTTPNLPEEVTNELEETLEEIMVIRQAFYSSIEEK